MAQPAIRFYVDVFGGRERMRMDGRRRQDRPRRGGHRPGDDHAGRRGAGHGHPQRRSVGGSPVAVMVYVEDVDSVFGRALAGRGQGAAALENQFYGDRSGAFEDPWGHLGRVVPRRGRAGGRDDAPRRRDGCAARPVLDGTRSGGAPRRRRSGRGGRPGCAWGRPPPAARSRCGCTPAAPMTG